MIRILSNKKIVQIIASTLLNAFLFTTLSAPYVFSAEESGQVSFSKKLSFPRKRESMVLPLNKLKPLDSRFRGNDNLRAKTLSYVHFSQLKQQYLQNLEQLKSSNDKSFRKQVDAIKDIIENRLFLAGPFKKVNSSHEQACEYYLLGSYQGNQSQTYFVMRYAFEPEQIVKNKMHAERQLTKDFKSLDVKSFTLRQPSAISELLTRVSVPVREMGQCMINQEAEGYQLQETKTGKPLKEFLLRTPLEFVGKDSDPSAMLADVLPVSIRYRVSNDGQQMMFSLSPAPEAPENNKQNGQILEGYILANPTDTVLKTMKHAGASMAKSVWEMMKDWKYDLKQVVKYLISKGYEIVITLDSKSLEWINGWIVLDAGRGGMMRNTLNLNPNNNNNNNNNNSNNSSNNASQTKPKKRTAEYPEVQNFVERYYELGTEFVVDHFDELKELEKTVGTDRACYLFWFGLSVVKSLITDEASFKKVAADLLKLNQALGWNYLSRGFTVLHRAFGDEFENHWDGFVELGVSAGKNAGILFEHGSFIVKLLINETKSLKEVWGLLIQLANNMDKLWKTSEVLDALESLRSTLNDDEKFKKYLSDILKLAVSADKNAYSILLYLQIFWQATPEEEEFRKYIEMGLNEAEAGKKELLSLFKDLAQLIEDSKLYNSNNNALSAPMKKYTVAHPKVQEFLERYDGLERELGTEFVVDHFDELKELEKAAGDASARFLFNFGLSKVKGLITDDISFKKVAADLLKLNQALSWDYLSDGFIELGKAFRDEFENHWDVFVELGIAAGKNAGILFDRGSFILKLLINETKSLKEVWGLLIQLAKNIDELWKMGQVLDTLKSLQATFNDEKKFKKYLLDILKLALAGGRNAKSIKSIFKNLQTIWQSFSDEEFEKAIEMGLQEAEKGEEELLNFFKDMVQLAEDSNQVNGGPIRGTQTEPASVSNSNNNNNSILSFTSDNGYSYAINLMSMTIAFMQNGGWFNNNNNNNNSGPGILELWGDLVKIPGMEEVIIWAETMAFLMTQQHVQNASSDSTAQTVTLDQLIKEAQERLMVILTPLKERLQEFKDAIKVDSKKLIEALKQEFGIMVLPGQSKMSEIVRHAVSKVFAELHINVYDYLIGTYRPATEEEKKSLEELGQIMGKAREEGGVDTAVAVHGNWNETAKARQTEIRQLIPKIQSIVPDLVPAPQAIAVAMDIRDRETWDGLELTVEAWRACQNLTPAKLGLIGNATAVAEFKERMHIRDEEVFVSNADSGKVLSELRPYEVTVYSGKKEGWPEGTLVYRINKAALSLATVAQKQEEIGNQLIFMVQQ